MKTIRWRWRILISVVTFIAWLSAATAGVPSVFFPLFFVPMLVLGKLLDRRHRVAGQREAPPGASDW